MEDTEPQVWEVEKILSKKVYKNKIYYKLKWADHDDPTWELADNCTCDFLIDQYENGPESVHEDDDVEDEEWEVERILDKRVCNNQIEYLVKWKGWPGEPSWEFAENCNCVNLIAAYENPKLRRLWDFTGSNQKLWLKTEHMLDYMRQYKQKVNGKFNVLRFELDYPEDEKPLELRDGVNIGPLCYHNHWYLVIILVNHICVTRRILVGDALNTLVGTNFKVHPVIKRLKGVYKQFPVKTITMTQMDRSDVCAFYTLAAFERAIFLLDRKAQFIVNNIYFDSARAELIRSRMRPETDGEISAALRIPESLDLGPTCEFCECLFDTWKLVDNHIRTVHIRKQPKGTSLLSSL